MTPFVGAPPIGRCALLKRQTENENTQEKQLRHVVLCRSCDVNETVWSVGNERMKYKIHCHINLSIKTIVGTLGVIEGTNKNKDNFHDDMTIIIRFSARTGLFTSTRLGA